jgi:hypothetical protein
MDIFGAPILDATTFAGQLQWYFFGWGFSTLLFTISFMISVFKKSGGGTTPDL